MRKTLLAMLLCGTTTFAQENYAQWPYSKDITLNTSATGANVAANVLNFPVVVSLKSGLFAFPQARKNGFDIRFAKSDGTHLKFQRERWDSAGMKGEFWVLLDTVKGNSTTQTIKMYWGKANAVDSSNGAAVFPASAGYVGVWHFGEAPNADVYGYKDASSNANHASAFLPPAAAEGTFSRAASFDGSQYLTVPDAPSLNPTAGLSISAWFQSTDWGEGVTNANRRILQKGNDVVGSANDYSLRELTASEVMTFEITGTGNPTFPTVDDPPINVWHLMHGSYDGAFKNLYLNGVVVSGGADTGKFVTNTSDLQIAHRPTSTSGQTEWRGLLDEVRIYSRGLDPNWVKLEYANQKASQNFMTMAAVSVQPDSRPFVRNGILVKGAGKGLVFSLPRNSGATTISLVDMHGRTLWSQSTLGAREVTWNGLISGGQAAQAGAYIVKMSRSGRVVSSRAITYSP